MSSNRISPEEVNARVLGENRLYLSIREIPKRGKNPTGKYPMRFACFAGEVEKHLNEIDKNATVINYCT